MTPAEATAELQQAEQDFAEAEQLVEALRERVRNGDRDVTPADITAQRELADFARLNVEAAQRRRDDAVIRDRQQRVEAVLTEARALVDNDDTAALAAAVSTALDGLSEAARIINARNAQVRQSIDHVERMSEELRRDGNDIPWPLGVRYERGHQAGLTIPGAGRAAVVHPGRLVAALAVAVLDLSQIHTAREVLEGPHPHRLAARLSEDIPALSDVLTADRTTTA